LKVPFIRDSPHLRPFFLVKISTMFTKIDRSFNRQCLFHSILLFTPVAEYILPCIAFPEGVKENKNAL